MTGATPNQCETDRDAAIESHTTGIQRAEDTRDWPSRSNRNSARITAPQRTVAILGGTYNLPMRARDTKCEVSVSQERVDAEAPGSAPCGSRWYSFAFP